MSSVVIQVGQCGNQLGQHFWKTARNDSPSHKGHVYENGDNKFRSVHIDSEPKVVKNLLNEFPRDCLREENVIVGHRGRGTNWALGYNGLRHVKDDHILDDALESIRREVERCSSFSGFILIHSLSGGTGSGLGSHLCECLRDEYPLVYQLSCVVAPYQSGESPLQNYNSLLCLTWLQRYSDCILYFSNDDVLYRLSKKTKLREGETGVSVGTMNQHIADCISNVVLPVDSVSPKGPSIGSEPWEMLRSVSPMPGLKFVHTTMSCKSRMSWDALCSSVLNTVQRYDSKGNYYSSLANLVVGKGEGKNGASPEKHVYNLQDKISAAYHCVPWNPFPVDFWTSKHNVVGGRDSASLTIAANYSNITDQLSHIVDCARQKYDARAYLHWYWKHGAEQGTFEEAFVCVDDVINNYKEAVK